jgi:thiol-disulfide isomerase/thioredoxin
MEEYLSKFNNDPKFANNRYLISAQNGVSALKNLQPGAVVPDFTLNDLDGNPVTLSNVYPNYKVTMIDFWAGWCGPCRRFNPYLVELYNKYKDHGFGIIGVSLDKEDQQWRDAIKEDNLTWTQVSDLQFWNAAPVKDYFVQSIPHNIFVDSEGRVIQRKVEKEDMDAFLAKLLLNK